MHHQTLLTLKPNPTTSKPTTTAHGTPNKQCLHSYSSSSEDTEPTHQGSQNDWQQIHCTKHKRIFSSQPTPQTPQTTTQNQYQMLTQEIPTTDQAVNPQPTKTHKPPPIFLHRVINYNKMIHSINEVAEAKQFYTKSLANNVIKITCLTLETY
jgi:hypothetical protein